MKNMGTVDRVVRAIAAVVLFVLAALVVQGAWEIVLWVVGAVLLATAAVGFCPLYYPLHLSTRK